MFDAAKLGSTPPQSELHYWADFVELQCMVDVDGHFSADRLATVAKFASDLSMTAAGAIDADESDMLDELLGEIGDVEPDIEDLVETEPQDVEESDEPIRDFGREAELTDDRRQWCQDIFALLADRQSALSTAYPFAVDRTGMRITKASNAAGCRLYIFLLLCSLLRYVPGDTSSVLTSAFERVSLHVFRAMLPPTAEVDAYGTARGGDSRFAGGQFERLKLLAQELRGKILVDEGEFHPRDTGDNGLDLVGWVPMRDGAKGVLSFFAQCACGAKWDGKQFEASHDRWREYIFLSSPNAKITFIPYYFRRPGGDWYAPGDVSGVLADRLRMMRFAPNDVESELTNLPDAAWTTVISVT